MVRADPKPTLTGGGLRSSHQNATSSVTTPSPRPGNSISRFMHKLSSFEQSLGNKRHEATERRYENPPKRMRRQSDVVTSQSLSQVSQGIGRASRSEPRQVTLETLKNWPQPRNAFAKTNVVHSNTQPSFPEPSRNSFEKLSKHLENAQPPAPPKTAPSNSRIVPVEPRRDSSLATTFFSEREMVRSGTLGLRTKVPATPQIFRPKLQPAHNSTINVANKSE